MTDVRVETAPSAATSTTDFLKRVFGIALAVIVVAAVIGGVLYLVRPAVDTGAATAAAFEQAVRRAVAGQQYAPYGGIQPAVVGGGFQRQQQFGGGQAPGRTCRDWMIDGETGQKSYLPPRAC